MIKSEKIFLPLPVDNLFKNEVLRLKKFSNGFCGYILQNKSKYRGLISEKLSKTKDKKDKQIIREAFEEASLDFVKAISVIEILKKEILSIKNIEKILDAFLIYFDEKIAELSLKIAKDVLDGGIPTDIKYLNGLAEFIVTKYLDENKGCKFCFFGPSSNPLCQNCHLNHVAEISKGWVSTGKAWFDYQCLHCQKKWSEEFD